MGSALDIGVGRDRLDRSDLAAPFGGVRAPAAFSDDFHTRCEAALLVSGPEAVLCGPTSAALFGLPLPARHRPGPLTPIHLALPAGSRAVRRAGITGSVLQLPPHHVTRWLHLATTRPARTWCDLATRLSLPELVAAGDRMLRLRLCTTDELARVADERADRRGIRVIREALDLLDPASESPKESELRVLVVRAGLPAPRANAEIRDEHGRFVARVDLLFEEYGEILEYHGDHHRTDRRQWRRDRTRESELESLGLHVTEVAADDLRDPPALLRRIARNLARRGWRGTLRL
ncbi:hypothetical protein FLP10_07625 [Agromyces intestinalis]|uniref:DUF559 domain-containing protein n=1 Tax=Agromyces intestinalis TaxID=2592652 RepID=A0A5C1YGT6_9MICO|nr:hypothetical protein [Agromyces intestinalis]QEO14299.1 hypothetical protein FLP10_07625 [Agromyces intestinalis]